MELNPYKPSRIPPPAARGNRRRIAGYIIALLGLALFSRISWIAMTWADFSVEEEANRVRVLSVLGICMMVAGIGLVLWSKRIGKTMA